MITFWILAALLTLLALAFVIPTLWRKHALNQQMVGDDNQRKTNINLYKERLAELDNASAQAQTDLEREALSEQKNELQRRLLHELDRPENQKQRQGHPAVAWSVLLILPILAIFLYQQIGSPKALTQDPAGNNPTASKQGQAPSMEKMIEKLRSRLADKPDDAEGWMMLGRAYQMMDKQVEASEAYKQSIDRNPLADANLLVAYAESLALSHDADLSGEPSKILARALKLDPTNVNALWLSGVAAYKANDLDKALSLWRLARDNATPDTDEYRSLNAQIVKLETSQGIQPSNALAHNNTASPQQTTTSQSIQVSVQISPAIQAQINPEHTLFIYAQAAQGPKMPLAIVRKQAKDLPIQVSLDSSMAMMPTMSLDKFEDVILLARISASGQAIPEAGDFMGQSSIVSWKDLSGPVEITIDQQR